MAKYATKAFLKKWVKALRSGKYKQVTGSVDKPVLTEDGAVTGYCCLGVAAKLKANQDKKAYDNYRHFGCTDTKDQDVKFTPLPQQARDVLISLNDTNGWSFKAIADYIEKKYINK